MAFVKSMVSANFGGKPRSREFFLSSKATCDDMLDVPWWGKGMNLRIWWLDMAQYPVQTLQQQESWKPEQQNHTKQHIPNWNVFKPSTDFNHLSSKSLRGLVIELRLHLRSSFGVFPLPQRLSGCSRSSALRWNSNSDGTVGVFC